jgi:hypothetical protein
MSSATRRLRPSRGIALLVATAMALVALLGCRTILASDGPDVGSTAADQHSASALGAVVPVAVVDDGPAIDDRAAAPAGTALTADGELAARRTPRQPATMAIAERVALLAAAVAAVATGLRHAISGVPDAGRATSGLRPPPLLCA